jgi:hypothetical protein
MKYLICLSLAILTVMGCKKQSEKDSLAEPEIEIDIELEELIALMTGSFNSERQATVDTNYRDVTVHMYPIWPDRDGSWLYVEQSLSDNQEEPYRQRIYKLSRENDSTLRSDIYTIPNAGLWACRWQTPEFFDRLLLETISIREGCEVLIKKVDDKFIGKTRGKNCPSDLQGATYVTSEVEISNNRIVTWDRGFNELDSLVWGALKGGYIFDKIN